MCKLTLQAEAVEARPLTLIGGPQLIATLICRIDGSKQRTLQAAGLKRLHAMQEDTGLCTKAFILKSVGTI
jgi:hypothetical protein